MAVGNAAKQANANSRNVILAVKNDDESSLASMINITTSLVIVLLPEKKINYCSNQDWAETEINVASDRLISKINLENKN